MATKKVLIEGLDPADVLDQMIFCVREQSKDGWKLLETYPMGNRLDGRESIKLIVFERS